MGMRIAWYVYKEAPASFLLFAGVFNRLLKLFVFSEGRPDRAFDNTNSW